MIRWWPNFTFTDWANGLRREARLRGKNRPIRRLGYLLNSSKRRCRRWWRRPGHTRQRRWRTRAICRTQAGVHGPRDRCWRRCGFPRFRINGRVVGKLVLQSLEQAKEVTTFALPLPLLHILRIRPSTNLEKLSRPYKHISRRNNIDNGRLGRIFSRYPYIDWDVVRSTSKVYGQQAMYAKQ